VDQAKDTCGCYNGYSEDTTADTTAATHAPVGSQTVTDR
jgi:hypothetical protein